MNDQNNQNNSMGGVAVDPTATPPATVTPVDTPTVDPMAGMATQAPTAVDPSVTAGVSQTPAPAATEPTTMPAPVYTEPIVTATETPAAQTEETVTSTEEGNTNLPPTVPPTV